MESAEAFCDLDVAVHFGFVKNIDLSLRGIYFLRVNLYLGSKPNAQIISPVGLFSAPSKLNSIVRDKAIPTVRLLDNCHINDDDLLFHTRTFAVRFKDEIHELNEAVHYRIRYCKKKHGCMLPYLRESLNIEVELMCCKLEKRSDADFLLDIDSLIPEEPVFESLSSQTLAVLNAASGIHDYFPVRFERGHVLEVDMMVHTGVTRVKWEELELLSWISDVSERRTKTITTQQNPAEPAADAASLFEGEAEGLQEPLPPVPGKSGPPPVPPSSDLPSPPRMSSKLTYLSKVNVDDVMFFTIPSLFAANPNEPASVSVTWRTLTQFMLAPVLANRRTLFYAVDSLQSQLKGPPATSDTEIASGDQEDLQACLSEEVEAVLAAMGQTYSHFDALQVLYSHITKYNESCADRWSTLVSMLPLNMVLFMVLGRKDYLYRVRLFWKRQMLVSLYSDAEIKRAKPHEEETALAKLLAQIREEEANAGPARLLCDDSSLRVCDACVHKSPRSLPVMLLQQYRTPQSMKEAEERVLQSERGGRLRGCNPVHDILDLRKSNVVPKKTAFERLYELTSPFRLGLKSAAASPATATWHKPTSNIWTEGPRNSPFHWLLDGDRKPERRGNSISDSMTAKSDSGSDEVHTAAAAFDGGDGGDGDLWPDRASVVLNLEDELQRIEESGAGIADDVSSGAGGDTTASPLLGKERSQSLQSLSSGNAEQTVTSEDNDHTSTSLRPRATLASKARRGVVNPTLTSSTMVQDTDKDKDNEKPQRREVEKEASMFKATATPSGLFSLFGYTEDQLEREPITLPRRVGVSKRYSSQYKKFLEEEKRLAQLNSSFRGLSTSDQDKNPDITSSPQKPGQKTASDDDKSPHRGLLRAKKLGTAPTEDSSDEESDYVPFGTPTSPHLVVLCHGFQGSARDMRLFSNLLSSELPNILVLTSRANEDDDGSACLSDLGVNLAKEVFIFCSSKAPVLLSQHKSKTGELLGKVSFIGHSMGGLVIRRCLQEPCMSPLLPRLHTYMSLASPHLGTLYADSQLVSAGMKVLFRLKGFPIMQELNLGDGADNNAKNAAVFNLSENGALQHFRWVILVSSPKDQYVPEYSARVQVSPKAEADATTGPLIVRMVSNLTAQVDTERVVRITLANNVLGAVNVDTVIGRAAHICYLANQAVAEQILYSLLPFFS